MVTLGDTHQHRLRPAVVVVHLREQQHDVGSPKRCRRPLSRFCRSASKLKCRAEIARPTSSSLRLAAVAHPPAHLCNGDCPPLPRVAREVARAKRSTRSTNALGDDSYKEVWNHNGLMSTHKTGESQLGEMGRIVGNWFQRQTTAGCLSFRTSLKCQNTI